MNRLEALVISLGVFCATAFGVVCVYEGIDDTVIKGVFGILGAAVGIGGGYVVARKKKGQDGG
jgi:hypothetical protein